jgi:hypothetical protein
MARFPAPYLNTATAHDPIMERCPMEWTGFGSYHGAGFPKEGVNGKELTLKHVAGALAKAQD